MMVFIVAAVMAGVAGGLYSHALSYTQPDLYSFTKSCDYLVFLYAGGTASLTGSVISAFVLTFLPEVLAFPLRLENGNLCTAPDHYHAEIAQRPVRRKEIPFMRCRNYRLKEDSAKQ